MNRIVFVLLMLFASPAFAQESTGPVPVGFVRQKLDFTDGEILKPKDWYYSNEPIPNGWTWTLTREDTSKGSYRTGLRLQMFIGVREKSGLTRQGFVDRFVQGKRRTAQVLEDCPVTEEGGFYRHCLEVIEGIGEPGKEEPFHVLYSLMWGKQMDLVVVSVFGAPPEEWASLTATVDAMSRFTLIGADFAKKTMATSKEETPPPATVFETVYNHVNPESEARGDDARFKALYGGRYSFIDIADPAGYVPGRIIAGDLPSQALAQDGTRVSGEAVLAFIVSPDGRAVEAVFQKISDERLRDTVLAAISAWRFQPATLDGKPIPTLSAQDFIFK